MGNQEKKLHDDRGFLRASEKRMKTFLDAIEVGIVVIEEEKKEIVYANHVAARMIGKNSQDIAGQPCWQFFCHQEKDRCPITKADQITKTDQFLKTADGKSIPIVKTVARINLNDRDHLLESFMDVSELKHVHEELERANKKVLAHQKALIEEERLKVLLQMAGVTAHELNQPLTALLGKIELMKMEKDDPAKLTAHLSTLEEASCRILEIAKRMQEIRRGEVWPFIGHYKDLELSEKLNILYVEDSDQDFKRISRILKQFENLTLFQARSVTEAATLIERGPFDLVFLEHLFSDGKSLDVIDIMNRRSDIVPVVVITRHGNEMIASQVIQRGAYDYLPKHMVSKESLARTISNALEKSRLKQEVRRAQQRMAEMTIRDSLTGLYNRRYFAESLEREAARALRYRSELVLCLLDIDHFKTVNDTFGHLAGDMVLSQLATMLKDYMRESDLLCRFGGEEFAIILTHTALEKAHTVCERFREMVDKRDFGYNGRPVHVTVSIGMAPYQGAAVSPWELVESADKALYEAKEAGRNRVVAYTAKHSQVSSKPAGTGRTGRAAKKAGKRTGMVTEKMLLGEMLVRAGRITAEQRDQAIVYQTESPCRIGEALTALGHVTAEDVNWAVANQWATAGSLQ